MNKDLLILKFFVYSVELIFILFAVLNFSFNKITNVEVLNNK